MDLPTSSISWFTATTAQRPCDPEYTATERKREHGKDQRWQRLNANEDKKINIFVRKIVYIAEEKKTDKQVKTFIYSNFFIHRKEHCFGVRRPATLTVALRRQAKLISL